MAPNLRDLEFFLEVAETSSVSRAAERLGITQPSLTLAMQRLEGRVGTPLLIRSKRGVSLTPGGRILAERAQFLCNIWKRVLDDVVAADQDVAGKYVVGCHSAVAAYTLPHCLPSLQRKYPALHVTLMHDLSRKVVESVISTRTDLGIVINPIRHPDLVIRAVCQDVVTFWQARSPVPINRDVLLCDMDLMQTQTLLRELDTRADGMTFTRTLASSSLEVIAGLVAEGGGIGILPARVAEQYALSRVVAAPEYHDELCLVYRVENKHVPALQAIVTHVAAALTRVDLTLAGPVGVSAQILA